MGNTPKKATTKAAWKGRRSATAGPLDLPSGNTALVKPLDPAAFLTSGWIPNPLMDIIRKAITAKKGLPPKAMAQIADDNVMLGSTLLLFDRVLTNVVVEPEIIMPPPCDVEIDGRECGEYATEPVHQNPTESGHHAYSEGARDEDAFYADEVDMGDKVFIFQWCLGGTRDLEKFRREQEATVGSLGSGQ